MFNDLHLDVGPPPGAYHLNEHWVQSNRFEVSSRVIYVGHHTGHWSQEGPFRI
jgi:hypothetical protein